MFKSQKAIVIISFISLLIAYQVHGQGCSDAGFCTMGAMKPSQSYNKKAVVKLRTLEVSQYRGKSTLSPTIFATTVDFNLGIGEKNGLQFKLPYQWVDGSLGNTAGLGDISVSLTRTLYQSERYQLNGTIGGKIATGNSTLNKDGADYPMYYQTSLGSNDIVFGFSYISNKWLLAVGYQQALNSNDVQFRYEEWSDYPDPAYIREYALANQLKRGTDVMLRVSRNYKFRNFDFDIGALPIYRITRDEIFDEESQSRINPEGTTGLALTVIFGAIYHMNTSSAIKFLYGGKITDRKFNPDGLTRLNVVSLAYLLRF